MSNKSEVQGIVESYKQVVREMWNSPVTDNNISHTSLKLSKAEECEGMTAAAPANANNGETSAYMAKNELFKIAKNAKELHDKIGDSDNLEPWLFSKITLAGNYIDSVKHYLDYENFRKEDSTQDHAANVLIKLKSMLHGEKREVLEQVMREVIFILEMTEALKDLKQ